MGVIKEILNLSAHDIAMGIVMILIWINGVLVGYLRQKKK